jgi:UDP-N-acetylmuramate dehydrogenase
MLDSDSKKWLASILGNAVRFDEPMSRHTSFRVGGPAEVFAAPESLETLISLVKGCEERELVYTVIGGGSNLLVKDSGIPGIVIGVRGNRAEVFTPHPSPLTSDLIVKAQAGASLSAFCMKAVKNGFAGMNFALGIPGTVGGGIMMNAGTALGSMENVLESVSVLGPGGKVAEIQRKEMIFAYRKFGCKAGFKPALLIEGCFRLCPGDPEKLKKEADEILETR